MVKNLLFFLVLVVAIFVLTLVWLFFLTTIGLSLNAAMWVDATIAGILWYLYFSLPGNLANTFKVWWRGG